jgi:hypothetical protein
MKKGSQEEKSRETGLTQLEKVMEPILVGFALVMLFGIFAWIVFLA